MLLWASLNATNANIWFVNNVTMESIICMVVLYDCRAPVFVWITHLIQFFGCMSGVYIISHVHVTCRLSYVHFMSTISTQANDSWKMKVTYVLSHAAFRWKIKLKFIYSLFIPKFNSFAHLILNYQLYCRLELSKSPKSTFNNNKNNVISILRSFRLRILFFHWIYNHIITIRKKL